MTSARTQSQRYAYLTILFVALILVCVAVSYLSSRFFVHGGSMGHDSPHGHQWLHQELNLTEAQTAAIDAFEGDYRAARSELRSAFETEIAELRALLMRQSEFTPETAHAIHGLHRIHGQLQELSIRHYFQMLEVLPPDKQALLRKIAGEALSVPE